MKAVRHLKKVLKGNHSLWIQNCTGSSVKNPNCMIFSMFKLELYLVVVKALKSKGVFELKPIS